MNGTEFNEWSENYFASFPRVGKFIDDLGRNDDGAAVVRVLGVWQRELATVELADAHEVTRRMLHRVEGFQPPADFKEHEIPVFVAKCCDKVKRQRIAEAMPRNPLDQALPMNLLKPMKESLWDMAVKVQEHAAKTGKSIGAASRELYPGDPEDEPRHRCPLCQDRGLVKCWAADSMHLAKLGKLTPEHGCYSTMVRCNCFAGDAYDAYSKRDWRKRDGVRDEPIIYNDQQWLTWYHREGDDEFAGNTQEGVDRLNTYMMKHVAQHGVTEFAY